MFDSFDPEAIQARLRELEIAGDRRALAEGYCALGEARLARGELKAAREAFTNGLTLLQILNDKPALAELSERIAAQLDVPLQAYGMAWQHYEKSLAAYEALGETARAAAVQWELARLALLMRDRAKARTYADASIASLEALDNEKHTVEMSTEPVRQWLKENGLA